MRDYCSLLPSDNTAADECYPLSLDDALPILKIGYTVAEGLAAGKPGRKGDWVLRLLREGRGAAAAAPSRPSAPDCRRPRSEEHTSELQSPYDLVCSRLLEKKKKRPEKILKHT